MGDIKEIMKKNEVQEVQEVQSQVIITRLKGEKEGIMII